MNKHLISKILILSLVMGLFGGIMDGGTEIQAKTKKKTLAIYFTYNENIDTTGMDVDAVTSASLNGESSGNKTDNIKAITKEVKKLKKADTFSIKVKNPYPAAYEEMAEIARDEIENHKTVALKTKKLKKLKNYKTIYLGTPIWWYDLPAPVETFLKANDFSGKTIYVYGIHEGSGFENNISRIKKLCPGAKVKKGITVWGDAKNKTVKKKADKWLKKIK